MKMHSTCRGLLPLSLALGLTLTVLPVKASWPGAAQTAEKGDVKKKHDHLQEAVNQLSLSDDQRGKVKDVFDDAKSKREAIWNDSSLNSEQKKDKMKSLHQETLAKVNEVLTPEQRAQLKDKLEGNRPSNY